MRRARILIVALFALAALPLGAVSAQYPQPLGACTITGPATLAPNTTAVYTITALTATGAPFPGQAFAVTISPAGSATATPLAGVTGADGKATVTVVTGANAANVSVTVTCGPLTGSTTISIVPGVVPKPPDTGAGLANGGQSFAWAWLAAGIVALGAAGAGATAVARRRR
jgi:hypothetical protein